MEREEAIQILADIIDNLFLHTWEKQNKALHMAIEALSAPQTDYISRADAIEAVVAKVKWFDGDAIEDRCKRDAFMQVLDEILTALPSADAEWIPCSERLPENIRPVLVTWKNNDPASYYQYIVGKHFIGTAHYYRGKWYWYSSATEDLLAEYGKCDTEEFDEAIEAVAWMPLPKPYREEDEV